MFDGNIKQLEINNEIVLLRTGTSKTNAHSLDFKQLQSWTKFSKSRWPIENVIDRSYSCPSINQDV